MKSAYQIIRRPVITEKGLGVKETEQTLVFEVAANGVWNARALHWQNSRQ